MISVNVIKYVGRVFGEMAEKNRRINEAYMQAYQRCFEGTPDEVALKLHAWDSTFESTRPRRSYSFI